MKKEILAYTAGLLDGEGSIGIVVMNPSAKNRYKLPFHQLHVHVVNTNKEVLDWLKDTFGGSICVHDKKSKSDTWTWQIYTKNAKKFLELIYPYLKIKRKQARLAIEFREYRKDIRSKPKEFQLIEVLRREEYRQKIMKLNHGGDSQ